jgi:hypothetical protein
MNKTKLSRNATIFQTSFAFAQTKSVPPRAAIQSPQPVLPMRLASSNTGKPGSAVAGMSP